MSTDTDRARKDFISEAEELVESFAEGISEVERQGRSVRPAVINDVFRAVHSLKGLAGMLGYGEVSDLAHRLEDLLDRLRLGKVQIDEPIVALLRDSAGAMTRLIGWIGAGEHGPAPEIDRLLGRVEDLTAGAAAPASVDELDEIDLDPQARKSLTEYEEHRLRENVRAGRQIYAISVTYDFGEFDTRLRSLTAALNGLGEVLSTLPSPDSSGAGISFRLLCGTDQEEGPVRSAAGAEADVRPLRLRAAPSEEQPEETVSIRSVAPTIRVDVTKLDVVMNIVGEMFLTRTRLEALVRSLRATQDRAAAAVAERLVRDVSRKLDELQKAVIDLRLVPVAQLYSRLSRVAHNVARELGKEIELLLEGADTELDKMLVELVADPLMHIVRNAIGHGIEPSGIRTAAGKPAAGRVTLRAYPRGSSVIIDVIDDGRGVDTETVRRRAMAGGLIAEGEEISAHQAHELLFAAGFSTAEEVSEISGRGVGLDVVRRNIQELKGSIEVFSETGRGTTFRITLPITLAIMNALIVRCRDEQYAIPLTSVDEIVRLDEHSLVSVGGQEAVLVRDRTFPLLRLAEVFGLEAAASGSRVFVVIARAGERQVALAVDAIERQQEIVIKSVGERVRLVPGVAGASDIGEDEVVLVLDIGSLVHAFSAGSARAFAAGA